MERPLFAGGARLLRLSAGASSPRLPRGPRRARPAPTSRARCLARETSSTERRTSPSRAGANFGRRRRSRRAPRRRGAARAPSSPPATDVEHTAVVHRGREQRLDDVADVDEVTLLQPVPEYRRLFAARETVEEDRDDTSLEARVLTRPVDVREPHDGVARPVDAVPAAEVLLGAELRDAVRRERLARDSPRRRAVALAVDRSARRGEDQLCSGRARGLEHAHRAHHVHRRVRVGPRHRGRHVGLCREVEDDVDPLELDAVADVALDEARAPD